jgi:hypothetical protein
MITTGFGVFVGDKTAAPLAVFSYRDHASAWGEEHYRGRHEIRPYGWQERPAMEISSNNPPVIDLSGFEPVILATILDVGGDPEATATLVVDRDSARLLGGHLYERVELMVRRAADTRKS